MGFITDLGKGFIRSAVNQVGRDTGKVISNKIYGDSHSTPIRNVAVSESGTYYNEENDEVISSEQLHSFAINDEWTPVYSSIESWKQKIFLAILSLIPGFILFPYSIVFPLVPIYIIYKGIKKIRTNQIIYHKTIIAPTYKSDKRYKRGMRYEGQELQTISTKLPITPEQRKQLRNIGIGYILIAIAMLFLAGILGKSYQSFTIKQEKIRKYETFIENAESKKQDIERNLRIYEDTTQYQKEMEDFIKQYKEAEEYLKNNE